MTGQTGLDLTRRDTFKRFTPVTIRFCDTDKLGHVNNVAIASYFEASRCELLDGLMREAGLGPDIDYVLVRIAIDFRREFHYPGTVDVGGRFLRLGTRSIVSAYGAFLGATCVATAEAVNVFFNLKTRRSVTPPASLRQLVEREIPA